jgi:hypothetical protein
MSRGLGRIERAILAEIENGRTPRGAGQAHGAHACYPEARILITANDPDEVRAGLREIVAALEQLAG